MLVGLRFVIGAIFKEDSVDNLTLTFARKRISSLEPALHVNSTNQSPPISSSSQLARYHPHSFQSNDADVNGFLGHNSLHCT